MKNAVILAVLAIVIGAAVVYVLRAKKKGRGGCIGCPDSHTCGGCCCRPKDE